MSAKVKFRLRGCKPRGEPERRRVDEESYRKGVNRMALQEIEKLATFNIKDLYDGEGRLISIQDLPRHVTASISKIKVRMEPDGKDGNGNSRFVETQEISFWDKKGSIELLMRHLNILGIEKREVTGKDGVPLIPPTKDCKLEEYSDAQIQALVLLAGQEDPISILPKE